MSDIENHSEVQKFVDRVHREFYEGREHSIDGTIERDFKKAIAKVFANHECPDCKYSILKGHQS